MLSPTEPRNPARRLSSLIVLAAALAAGAALVWYLSQPSTAGQEAIILTPEAREYTRNLKLGDVEMKATDNTLGQTLVEITGMITNGGDRPVRNVVLTCVFYDPYGEALARELAPIVRGREGVLSPGESRRFRLPFDSLPEGWNQAMPQLVIAQIQFE